MQQLLKTLAEALRALALQVLKPSKKLYKVQTVFFNGGVINLLPCIPIGKISSKYIAINQANRLKQLAAQQHSKIQFKVVAHEVKK